VLGEGWLGPPRYSARYCTPVLVVIATGILRSRTNGNLLAASRGRYFFAQR